MILLVAALILAAFNIARIAYFGGTDLFGLIISLIVIVGAAVILLIERPERR